MSIDVEQGDGRVDYWAEAHAKVFGGAIPEQAIAAAQPAIPDGLIIVGRGGSVPHPDGGTPWVFNTFQFQRSYAVAMTPGPENNPKRGCPTDN